MLSRLWAQSRRTTGSVPRSIVGYVVPNFIVTFHLLDVAARLSGSSSAALALRDPMTRSFAQVLSRFGENWAVGHPITSASVPSLPLTDSRAPTSDQTTVLFPYFCPSVSISPTVVNMQ